MSPANNDVPEEVTALVREREQARQDRRFDHADALRDQIRGLGFEVADAPEGPVVERRSRAALPVARRPTDVPNALGGPPIGDATVHWLNEGWPEDILRGIESMRRHRAGHTIHQVVVDRPDSGAGWPADVEVVIVDPAMGWAAARNAGLRRTAATVAVVADGSVEAEGDVIGPLLEALRDPSVGIAGAFGVTSDDLHEFREAEGPDVDAVEAYLLAVRRDLLQEGLAFDERFRFYRNADLELSFQVKAQGLRAVVVQLPVTRHAHRVWEATSADERDRLSRRNFARFLERWRSREDLLERNRTPE